jgi:4-azaleucine resistance transporter AzlC
LWLFNTNIKQFWSKGQNTRIEFERGVKLGLPIGLGYLPVSFTFGMMAVSGGLPVWMAVLISLTNLTSAGQFAGTGLIIANASLFEITLTTLVINIRYMLMSLSLSQQTTRMPLAQKGIVAFGITDETFAVAALEKNEVSFAFMLGLITCPYLGWALGTVLGAVTTSLLPEALQSAMGIALYAMFIALVVPAAKNSQAALTVAAVAVLISSLLKWLPGLRQISTGWSIIVATVIAATIGAFCFPEKDEAE